MTNITKNVLLLISAAALLSCAKPPNTEVTSTEQVQIVPTHAVQFETTCGANVEPELSKSIELLHSFEYVETGKKFDALIAQNPPCAMAYWGAAMSIWHPLWAPPNQEQMARGMKYLAQTGGLDKSPREAGLIDALKQFFSSTDITTNKDRARAYSAAMQTLSATYPDDIEIEIFYALSLLSTADPRDKSYVNQHKAGDLLRKLQETQPQHPGVLHYIIHSYDYPGLADTALGAAKTYAQSAKNSTHAQHMPSHIFTRLGMWESSLSSNHDSNSSAERYTVRAKLLGHYDQGLHSIDYLMYAMMQTGRDDEAKALLARLGKIKKTDTENFVVAFTYAATPARYALERRAWNEASEAMLIRQDFHWDQFGWAKSMHYFARGIGAARSGKLEQAKAEMAVIREIQQGLPATVMPYFRTEVQVQLDTVHSWILFGEGDTVAALKLASAAANMEDSVDKHPVTPGEILPARELYADMLQEAGHHEIALAQYRHVLTSSPNRLNALVGAARSSARMGDAKTANEYANIIRAQVHLGDRAYPEFEVK